MLLFGHRFIDYQPFYHIEEIDAIDRTPSNSTLFVKFHESTLDIITHLQKHDLSFALEVSTLIEVVYAHNLGARYILVSPTLSKSAQDIAENYLFDAKILCRLESEDMLEEKIIEGIDGVIFSEAILKVTN